jgi:hypothetical protein
MDEDIEQTYFLFIVILLFPPLISLVSNQSCLLQFLLENMILANQKKGSMGRFIIKESHVPPNQTPS